MNTRHKTLLLYLLATCLLLIGSPGVQAQHVFSASDNISVSDDVMKVNPAAHLDQTVSYTGSSEQRPSQWGALLRSLVVPGWGHHYVDSDNWRTGQYHLAAEVVLLTTWLGIYRQSWVVEKNMYTFARAHSGVDIREHGRAYELAVGDHRSMDEYIDYLERMRQWDQLDNFPETREYFWEWESDELRREYRDMRSRRDNLDRQLPTLAAFMVVNRLLSGVGAYSRARSYASSPSSVYVVPGPDQRGFEARLRISF